MGKKSLNNTNKVKKTMRATSYSPRSVDDFKTAALIVSVGINVAVFVGWLALKITTEYDAQVFKFLFDR